jgi:putative transposase
MTEQRIANAMLFKLGLRVSPRTVRKYMPAGPEAPAQGSAPKRFVACDFCAAITATFRLLYVFVVLEHSSPRLLHLNITPHLTAARTLQQLCYRHRMRG